MDIRIATLRSCAQSLCPSGSAAPGGDEQIGTLLHATQAALELGAEILLAQAEPTPRGYKDICDRLALLRIITGSLAERLKVIFDVSEKMPHAWSTISGHEFRSALGSAPAAFEELADTAERWVGAALSCGGSGRRRGSCIAHTRR